MIKNVYNPEDIDKFLQELAEGNDKLAFFLQVALGKAILKKEEFFTPLKSYPSQPPQWLTLEKFFTQDISVFSPELAKKSYDHFLHIKDWLKGSINNGDTWTKNLDEKGRPIKLLNINSLEDAYLRAEKDMRLRANNLRSSFGNSTSSFEIDEALGHIKAIKNLPNGYRLVKLLTPHALDFETAQLGHCLGNGAYDNLIAASEVDIYSLRSPLNKSVVTFEVQNNNLLQCKGKQNEPPANKYISIVQEIIRDFKWTISENVRNTGLIEINGTIYDVRNLPEGMTSLSLNLSGTKWLTKLPANFTCSWLVLKDCINLTEIGDNLNISLLSLDISGCTNLVHLPENLYIKSDLKASGCTSLIELPKTFTTALEIDLSDCTSLERLPDNLHVRSRLNLSGCTSLKQLPENLVVEDKLNLSNCKSLTSLPESIRPLYHIDLSGCDKLLYLPNSINSVHGYLHLDECINFRALPENLTVRFELSLSGCTSLCSLPKNLTARELDISRCSGISYLPEGLSIKGLYASGCINLKALPDSLRDLPQGLDVSTCINLEKLPDNLQIGGDLNISNCNKLHYLPETISIENNLILNDTALKGLPSNLTVGKQIWWDGKVYDDVATFRQDFNLRNFSNNTKPPSPNI